MNNFSEKANFVRSVADLIQEPYWPNHCKVVMLPVTVLRWPDCVLEPTRAEVLDRQREGKKGRCFRWF